MQPSMVGSMSPMAHTSSPRLRITPGKLWALGGVAVVAVGCVAVLGLMGGWFGNAPTAPGPTQRASVAASVPPVVAAPLESPRPVSSEPTATPLPLDVARAPATELPSAVQVAPALEPNAEVQRNAEVQPSRELESPVPSAPKLRVKRPLATAPARPRRPPAKAVPSEIEEKYGF